MRYMLIHADGTKETREGFVSPHITDLEAKCPCCSEAILFEPTIKLFEKARELTKKPLRITSFYRCLRHQADLVEAGYKAAKNYPPHTYGVAMDISIPASLSIKQLMEIFIKAAKELGYPRPRLGHKAYKDRFLHVDLAFMLKPNPCPNRFYSGAEW